jgi:predicted DCC family thiol-disulfide oxidoreductase YuxK
MHEIRKSGEKAEESIASPIVLFDGVCNLCSLVVKFTILRDPDGIFGFAYLESEPGRFYTC